MFAFQTVWHSKMALKVSPLFDFNLQKFERGVIAKNPILKNSKKYLRQN
jgi:hypothetical protein